MILHECTFAAASIACTGSGPGTLGANVRCATCPSGEADMSADLICQPSTLGLEQVLMHAGPEGFMVRDIIQKAAEMRIVDWEGSKGKKSHISGCIGKERRFVHVGGWKCAPSLTWVG